MSCRGSPPSSETTNSCGYFPSNDTNESCLPSAALREKVIQTAFRRGLLLLGCGETAIRFCPPLCVSAAQVETALTILDGVELNRFAVEAV